MPDLLHDIEALLNSPQLRENLPGLFCEKLLWGKAKTGMFQREVTITNGESVSMTFTPVAQLSGLPVFMVEWPISKPPTMTDRRVVYNALAKTYVEHLLVYVTDDENQASFVWARRRARDGDKEDKKARIELRTLPYQVGYPARTTIQQISKLAFSIEELGLLGEPGTAAVKSKLNAAFDVEAVTKEFFKTYRDIFYETEKEIEGIAGEACHLYTQKLFNRLMFLIFLERKGWLTFNGRKDYLHALWEDYRKKRLPDEYFYNRLKLLFFCGLNTPNEVNIVGITKKGIIHDLIGDVPYLNGGLFEEDEDDKNQAIHVPDDLFPRILDSLFYHFNFTVTESTPLDVEVAVDPEMLGRIFEELVTSRHETGSYYTPKPVVAFMCHEALNGYLQTALPGETAEAIQKFVDENDAVSLRDPEGILVALRIVKACDPACGSGAYLLGLLHELLDLRECLFAAHQLDPRTVYDRKMEIIQNNLYGVDIDPFAVNIARLRLWLSLVVDFEGNDPPPLPNLDFKIECGDSLNAPDPSGGLEIGFRSKLVDEFLQAKKEYLTAHHSEKLALREVIEKKRVEIITWLGRSAKPSDELAHSFDWVVEFAEIFSTSSTGSTVAGAMKAVVNATPGQMETAVSVVDKIGFDIVLANPPYVRADAQFRHIENEAERQTQIAGWQQYRKTLKSCNIYETLYEKWDLYIPFLERAFQLINPGGQMVYIISDAYNAAKYAAKSHEFFLLNTRVERIEFCSDIPLFQAGVNNTILHFEKGAPSANHKPVRARRWGDNPDDFDDNLEFLETYPQSHIGINLFSFEKKQQSNTNQGFIELGKVFYISYGLRPNADDKYWRGEFTTKDCLSPVQDKYHPKKLLQGKDVEKWRNRTTQYLEWGTKRAPSKFARPTFVELYEVPEKLIAVKVSPTPKVAYDASQYFHSDGAISFVPWHYLKGVINRSIRKTALYRHQSPMGDREERESISQQFNLKYILVILNSYYVPMWLATQRRNKLQLYPDDWKQLPIAPISLEEQKPFVKLVDEILAEFEEHGYPLPAESAQRVSALERELDEMVARLYASE